MITASTVNYEKSYYIIFDRRQRALDPYHHRQINEIKLEKSNIKYLGLGLDGTLS